MTYQLAMEACKLYLRLSGMVTRSLREVGDVDDKLYRVCSKARMRWMKRAGEYLRETGEFPWKKID